MAHHQHHGAEYEAQVSRSLQSRPSSTTLPSISEDEQVGDADEPPDHSSHQTFSKTRPPPNSRRQSLLTKAFHTDSESHGEEEQYLPLTIGREHSLSSTCSNYSTKSMGDFTSDDGLASNGTRASTPCSPRSVAASMNPALGSFKPSNNPVTKPRSESTASKTSESQASVAAEQSEPTVEAELGRKRFITFACGARKDSTPPTPKAPVEETKPAAPQKKPCALNFLCPSKVLAEKTKTPSSRTARRLSPAPFTANHSPSPRRSHRDSDTTIKSDSPKVTRHIRRISDQRDPSRSEATRFHEFASSDEEVEEWVEESTAFRTRLTVNDTLKKENDIRKLAEEAEEEEALDDAEEDDEEDDEDEVSDTGYSSDDEVSETGFRTDDEDGFAESDDSDDDSDYEWWVPRKSPTASPFVNPEPFVPKGILQRTASNSSANSNVGTDTYSPRRKNGGRLPKPSRPVNIRTESPDLPDSTDFVCGTLDEDRPLEAAFASQLQLKRAAKHRVVPQDIDPTFPTSDPEIENDDNDDDNDDDDDPDNLVEESDQNFLFLHGKFEQPSEDNSVQRGRQPGITHKKSPRPSPLRLRSPPVQNKRCTRNRSPAPAGMCGTQLAKSPAPAAMCNKQKRSRSPAPVTKTRSPSPKQRTTKITIPTSKANKTEPGFLGEQKHEPAYTASLPRSPGPLGRRRSSVGTVKSIHYSDDEDEGDQTANERAYHRGAIDIVQGLENKRLRRRQKFYERYCKKEERKEKKLHQKKKPQPGKGAERMRQVGIECAQYRGKRVLSI